jgi:antitoxin component of MazEF toxin-antitoxin module
MAPRLSKLGRGHDVGVPTLEKRAEPDERHKDSSTRPRYRLEQLFEGITKRNRHSEVNWGRRVGKEVW